MPSTFELLQSKRDEILALAEKHGLKDVRVFGSVARGEDTENSDVDILVNRIPGVSLGLKTYGFPVAMEKILGRRVDFVVEPTLHWMIRDDVLKEARPI